ncbi:MAG: serine hydrolase domain-containing protein [Blastocatellia bacterium]
MKTATIRSLFPGLAVLLCLCALSTHAQTRDRARDWPVSAPEAQGVDSTQLAATIEQARERGVNIHSLLIVRNGFLVTEACFSPYDGKTPHDVASVTKSVTATLVGMAIADGKIAGVGQSALSLYAGRAIANQDARKEKILVSHLLTMSSGLNCIARGGEPTLWEMLGHANNTQFMLDLPMTADPGSGFTYCSGGMHLLSGILSRVTGMNEEAYARRRLFAPLGIGAAPWPSDPQSVSHGFGNLHLTPRDMAKYGWLYLNKGRWNGKQIVPAAWIDTVTRAQIKTGNPREYGYGWWIPANGPVAYEASGRGGQQISVLPALNTVIVLTGGGYNTGDVMKMILPAIRTEKTLPANPAGVARLQAAVKAAATPLSRPFTPPPAIARTISGKTWDLERNWMGLESVSLEFGQTDGPAQARLRFGPSLKQAQYGMSAKVRGQGSVTESRPVGLNGVPVLSGNGVFGYDVGMKGTWESDSVFVLEYDEIANVNHYILRLTFSGDTVAVHAKEQTGLFDEKFSGRARP